MTTLLAIPHVRPTARPSSWSRSDTHRLSRLLAVVAALHVVGWGGLALIAPAHHTAGNGALFGFGLGLTAYMFGVRHAFDADHLAVIDGTTRKLAGDGQRPLSVGLWFSLGHSSVVVVMAAAVALGARFTSSLVDEGSSAHQLLSTVGTGTAGLFLWTIGLVNLVALTGMLRARRAIGRGETDPATQRALHPAGVLARLIGGVLQRITSPRQAYPVGVLMGLGFDTATEVALLILAATAAVTLPWYALMLLPVLFAAGMTLFDTLDGALMNVAYHWAAHHPTRTITYNAAVTAVSVLVTLGVGSLQLLKLGHDDFLIDTAFTAWTSRLSPAAVSTAVLAVVATAWIGAIISSRRAPTDQAPHRRSDLTARRLVSAGRAGESPVSPQQQRPAPGAAARPRPPRRTPTRPGPSWSRASPD